MARAEFILSAFADEIDQDPDVQLDVLERCGVRYIELRSAWGINVLDWTDAQVQQLKRLFDRRGLRVSAIGSPIGKVLITDAWEPHLQRFRRALELCRVFEAPRIRIFSYYLPPGHSWEAFREEVLRRMRRKVELAEENGVWLLHENEHRIYGEAPERVLDLLTTVHHPRLRAVFDAANYVYGGYDPWQAWLMTREWTAHFHIKDWVAGEHRGRKAGDGQGRLADVLADAASRGYRGFATLEPHLLGGGPTGGVTGPELFPEAVAALRAILDRLGVPYR
ncbi:MAG: sugar phosphate isomerase/epimerase [Gemmataceae bacterium]